MVNQIISAIPQPGKRGIDARTTFVTKQEAFQDHLYDNTVDELNTFAGEVNNTTTAVNTTLNSSIIVRDQTTQKASEASSSATVASQKASEASTSANQALTYKNQLQGYVIPAGTSYSVDQINTQNSAMTKAQFLALCEERKANRAGSGWDEWGTHNSSKQNVNEGILCSTETAYTNSFFMGWDFASGKVGVSKTSYPLSNVNGVLHKLRGVNIVTQTYEQAKVTLPTAPNIYPHDTVLTPEQIASGVIKHADASNSGLIVNGKFDTDTAWSKASGWSISGGQLLGGAGTNGDSSYQAISTVIGKKYIIEYIVSSITGTLSTRVTETGVISTKDITTAGIYTFEFTATTNTHYLHFTDYCTSVAIDGVSVYPADAISRSDLVFPESYHEDIAEKGFGYPFGNIQYLGGNTDGLTGITNGAFSGFEQYSLFGNWQTPSALIGKGYVWSSLSEAQKRAFISNPENNCYLDGDKTIQVRYRVRVIQGWGDNWGTQIDTASNVNKFAYFSDTLPVKVKGKLAIETDIDGSAYPHYVGILSSKKNTLLNIDLGIYGATNSSSGASATNIAYEGKCFALPLALVHRRNQGLYHNTYNPNGTKLASDGLDCFRTTISFTSTMDCFDPAKLLTASGYIGTVSGRPDGLFYDQVHESDITDLRNSSKKVEDYNRLISREFNKLVAGTTRGKEGEIISVKVASGSTTGLGLVTNNYIDFGSNVLSNVFISKLQYPNLGIGAYIRFETSGKTYILKPTLSDLRAAGDGSFRYLYYTPVDSTGFTAETGTWSLYFPTWTTRTKSNTLLHCDIIGNPTNYPTAWKESGVFGAPLIVAEDGTSLLPDGTKDSFKLSRKANATPLLCLRSTDNGITWTSFTPTFSTTTNAITLTDEPAGNLVQVFYHTHTSMAVPAVQSGVIEIGKVFSTNHSEPQHGAYLTENLIGKVPVWYGKSEGYPLKNYELFGKTFWENNARLPVHEPLTYNQFATSNPAVKVLTYLTTLNGKAYLNLMYKELKHNGTSWGDDSKIPVLNYVSTTTDNNAQTVLIGQKKVELPYFIDAGE